MSNDKEFLDQAEQGARREHGTHEFGARAYYPIYVTPEKYCGVREAEGALQIGRLDPNGPNPSPTHRIKVDLKAAKFTYGGSVEVKGTES